LPRRWCSRPMRSSTMRRYSWGGAHRAVLHWTIPASTASRNLNAVAISVGNYDGKSNGVLVVEVCSNDGRCAKGRRPVSESVDNIPFTIPLDGELPITSVADGAGTPLTVAFDQQGASYPVVLWVDGMDPLSATKASLEGQPEGTSLAISLLYSASIDQGGQVISYRKAYDGTDMTIYELLGAKPYYEAINGDCSVLQASRETATVRCGSGGTLLRREAFYPGWHAYVDGQNQTIKREHAIFQAISLVKGVHRITYRYTPTGSTWILGGFLLGAIACLLAIVSEWRGSVSLRHKGKLRLGDPPESL
jgi:hypothetical protein